MSRAMEEMRRQAIEEGREEGIDIARKKSAKAMLTDGKLSFEEIARYSGLSMDEVRRLAGEEVPA